MPLSKLELAVMSLSCMAPDSMPSGAMHCAETEEEKKKEKEESMNTSSKKEQLREVGS